MTRPRESDYASHTAYTRALEAYCDFLENRKQFVEGASGDGPVYRGVRGWGGSVNIYDITGAEPPPPDSGFARLESL